MAKEKYNIFNVLTSITAKSDIKVIGHTVCINRNQTTIGKNSWGKIDFLTHKGYRTAVVANVKKLG